MINFGDGLDIRRSGAGVDQIIHMIGMVLEAWNQKVAGVGGKPDGTV